MQVQHFVLPGPAVNATPVLVASGPCMVSVQVVQRSGGTFLSDFLAGDSTITPIGGSNPGFWAGPEGLSNVVLRTGEDLYLVQRSDTETASYDAVVLRRDV